MLQKDAARILELKGRMTAWEEQMAQVAGRSCIVGELASVPG